MAMMGSAHFETYLNCPICQQMPPDKPFYEAPYGTGKVLDFVQQYYHGRVDPTILKDAHFVIQWCRSCDFYWHQQVLNSENLSQLYNQWIDPKESYQKHAHQPWQERVSIVHAIARQLHLLKSSQPPFNVLDFGGGWGSWAIAAKALGCEVYLVETSKERVHFAQQQGLNVVQSLAEFPSASLDLILLNQVLEHIPQPKSLLLELVERLKVGGGCSIAVPMAKSTVPVLTKGAFQPLEHVNGFTPKSLRRIAEACGLTLCKEYFLYSKFNAKSLMKAGFVNACIQLLPDFWLPLRTNIFAVKN
jgi:2-polyprenyl-3-methyl-5-hydroxy-6-metoxy-1,4-benzoquinol methylase